MEKNYFLESKKKKYYSKYKVSNILEIIKEKTGYIVQNNELEIDEKPDNTVGFKLLHGKKKTCELDFEAEMMERFERDNNQFILKLDKNSKIEKILNKQEMIKNIDNKLFQYMEGNIKNSGKIIDLVYSYKKQLENEDEMEFFMNTEGVSSYFFIDIFDKEYSPYKETKIIKHIGNIVPRVAIPVEFNFKIKKQSEYELFLDFTSDYSGMASHANIVNGYKKTLGLPEYEKFEFYLEIKGRYIINTRENKLKKYNILRKLCIGGVRYNNQITMEGIKE